MVYIKKGNDGIIFIWDAEMNRIQDNLHVLEQLLDLLPQDTRYPIVLSINKTDLPNPTLNQDVRRLLNENQLSTKLNNALFTDIIYPDLLIYETIGVQGLNVQRVLKTCLRMIVNKNRDRIQEIRNALFQEVRA